MIPMEVQKKKNISWFISLFSASICEHRVWDPFNGSQDNYGKEENNVVAGCNELNTPRLTLFCGDQLKTQRPSLELVFGLFELLLKHGRPY